MNMTIFTDDFLKEHDIYVSHHHFKTDNYPLRNKIELRHDGKELIGTVTFLSFGENQKKAVRAFLSDGYFVSIIDNCATAIQLTPTGNSGFYVANVVKKVFSNTVHLINKSNFNSYENMIPEEITEDYPIHIVFAKKGVDEPLYDNFGYVIN
jgi:hypothetical protein